MEGNLDRRVYKNLRASWLEFARLEIGGLGLTAMMMFRRLVGDASLFTWFCQFLAAGRRSLHCGLRIILIRKLCSRCVCENYQTPKMVFRPNSHLFFDLNKPHIRTCKNIQYLSSFPYLFFQSNLRLISIFFLPVSSHVIHTFFLRIFPYFSLALLCRFPF